MRKKEKLLTQWLKIISRALRDTVQHDGIEHAGYLAFVSLLSFFPFLVLLVSITGKIGASEAGQTLVTHVLSQQVIPQDILAALAPRMEEIASGPPLNLLTLAIIGALWTASSMVEGIRTTLNRAARVNTPPPYLLRRLLSIAEFLIITFIIILTLVACIIVPIIWKMLEQLLGISIPPLPKLFENLRLVVAITLLFCSTTAMYYFIPSSKQRIRDVIPGAFIAVFLWYVAGIILNAYLDHFQQVHLIYGSLAGIIAALLFFYLSAMIFIFGAEVNYHYAK